MKQVVVVEGKTDAERIKKAFPEKEIDFLISGGLGFTNEFLELCKKINEERGIIIFTDPDGPGRKIRDAINEFLEFKCENAFIDKNNIKNSKKIGVAEAELGDIVKALESKIKFNNNLSSIS